MRRGLDHLALFFDESDYRTVDIAGNADGEDEVAYVTTVTSAEE